MKIRQGFVSNSSSSSFIICEDEVENIKNKGVKVYKIKDIHEEFERLSSLWFSSSLPGFMLGTYFNPEGFRHKIEKLFLERPNDYITEDLEDGRLKDCDIDICDYKFFERF